MGVFTLETENAATVAPEKLFQAVVLDCDTIGPKAVPQAIKSVETLEGNGGAGTIKKITFGEAASHLGYVKHRVDSIDKEKFIYNYTVIEGGALDDTLEKITYENKIVPSLDGGSVWKTTCKFYPKGDKQVDEEKCKNAMERASGILKAIAAYLMANPN
ncbi:major allergen Pru ar 1-like [Tripterygium wilfordii]|uniref:major allergen Pru ar 1-like n=1 Tax=Tripterygium wilfordii TaxID=458696 RepID=UPI0018F7E930|nr:major allergen Pru ar 1-like [Tripterygium wilfordii]